MKNKKLVQVPVPAYKLSKSVEKWLYGFFTTIIVAALSYFVANHSVLSKEYPQYAFFIAAAVGFARFVLNYLKHKEDIDFIEIESE